MTASEKIIKYFKILLIFIITSIIFSKAVSGLFLAFGIPHLIPGLIRVKSLTQLLPLSKVEYFKLEYLFRVGLAFSDLTFNFKTLITLLSLFDVLPLLAVILLLEVNRITTRSKSIRQSLVIILILYVVKYLGLFLIVFKAFTLNYNFDFILGINCLGYILLFIAISQIITLYFLAYKFYLDLKIVKVE